MCGFLGYIKTNNNCSIDNEHFSQSLDLMSHRGPDEGKIINKDNWGLGFRRLSILDLSLNASQPMSTSSNMQWIVFNGEIYNYKELRLELIKDGINFNSSGDSEVLLKWIKYKGSQKINQINGMFAFAYIDLIRKKLILARDRVGKKPLFIFKNKNIVIFSSEIKSLLYLGKIQPEIDRLSINQYFSYNYVPAPRTIFKNIYKVMPANFIEFSIDNINENKTNCYWDLTSKIINSKTNYSNEKLETIIQNSISDRLYSDVPIGTFLSGGIDSSIVSGIASKQNKNITAYTIGFNDRKFDESNIASAVAKHFKIKHISEFLEPTAWEILPELAWHHEEPFADASSIPTYFLCKKASQYGKVFLSGDGGDEIFAGYSRYLRYMNQKWYDEIPHFLSGPFFNLVSNIFSSFSIYKYRALKLALPAWKRLAYNTVFLEDPINLMPLDVGCIMPNDTINNTFIRDAKKYHSFDDLKQIQLLDISYYLSNDILTKIDRTSMANSIEVRSPLLDYRIIEEALKIHSSFHISRSKGKRMLDPIAQKMLPDEALEHPKQGFGVPIDKWMRLNNYKYLNTYFHDAIKNPYLNKDSIEKIFNIFIGKRYKKYDYSHLIWKIIFFQEWYNQFIDSDLWKKARRKSIFSSNKFINY